MTTDPRGRARRWARRAAGVLATLLLAGACGTTPGDPDRSVVEQVAATPDPGTRLQAAVDYLWVYPSTPHRPRLAQAVVAGISRVGDPRQQAELVETFLTVFDTPPDLDLAVPLLASAYTRMGNPENVFRVLSWQLSRHPDDVVTMTRLARIGFDEMIHSANPSFLAMAMAYTAQAIAAMEQDRRPRDMSEADWQAFKAQWLPDLYRELGAQSLRAGNWRDARAKLERAAKLRPSDPSIFRLFGDLTREEYQLAASQAQYVSGPAGAEARRRAQEKLDQAIELYARAVALAEGTPEKATMQEQVLPRLTEEYTRRYGSTDGLRQLIDRAKTMPWAPAA